MEELHAEGKVRRLGITNFTLAQMQAFIAMVKVRARRDSSGATTATFSSSLLTHVAAAARWRRARWCQVPPRVNQVDLENCCFLPKELIEFAKAHRIELLTHGDRSGSFGSRPATCFVCGRVGSSDA